MLSGAGGRRRWPGAGTRRRVRGRPGPRRPRALAGSPLTGSCVARGKSADRHRSEMTFGNWPRFAGRRKIAITSCPSISYRGGEDRHRPDPLDFCRRCAMTARSSWSFWRCVMLSSAAIALGTAVSWAEDGLEPGLLSGTLVDSARKPVDGAHVSLQKPKFEDDTLESSTEILAETTSDCAGQPWAGRADPPGARLPADRQGGRPAATSAGGSPGVVGAAPRRRRRRTGIARAARG